MRFVVAKTAFIFLGLVSSELYAGNEAGNGGDIVRCQLGNRFESVELLDFFEGRVVPPVRSIDLGDSSWNVADKISYALSRLEKFDPTRALWYREEAARFFDAKYTRWVNGVELRDIPDSGYVPVPENCRIQQIAIQKEPLTQWHRLYTVDAELWGRLSRDHQAGLALHEIAYGEAIRRGQRNSVSVRKYVALIASRDIEALTQAEYDGIVSKLFPAPTTVAFKSDLIEYLASAGENFSANLNEKLVVKKRNVLTWSTLEQLPRWLTLDSKSGLLSGVPPKGASTTLRFNVAVDDGLVGTVVPVSLWITLPGSMPPIWVVDPIIFPDVKTNRVFDRDLSGLVINPSGWPLTFRKGAGANWLVLSLDGKAYANSVPPVLPDPTWSILASTADGGVSPVTLTMKIVK